MLSFMQRIACERSLYRFVRAFWPAVEGQRAFHDGTHIRIVCAYLESVAKGAYPFSVINIPPRHMKTLLVSVMWPAWLWAQKSDPRYPLKGAHVKFLSASYSQTLSADASMLMRRIVESDLYRKWWGDRVQLTGDQNVKTRFANTSMGYRFATSVGGTVTGTGGDIIVIDDASKPDEAQSEVQRQSVLDWWTGTMSSRMNDPINGARLIVGQRIHENDLPGYVLRTQPDVSHLCLPARFEEDHPHKCPADKRSEGELLWPAHMPEMQLAGMEKEMGEYISAGQLQQRPSPREGGMFKEKDWKWISAAPAHGDMVRSWDFAASTRKKSPYTVGTLMKFLDDEFYICDVIRERTDPAGMHRLIINTAARDGHGVAIDFPQDPGSAGKDQARIIAGKLAGYKVSFSPETGDKETRAEPFASQQGAGNVYLVKADWNNAYVAEAKLFPNSDYKDQIDASSRGFAWLATRNKRKFWGGAELFGG